MRRPPCLEIITEPAVAHAPDICPLFAEAAAAAGGDIRVWQLSEHGGLPDAARAALSRADVIVFAPSLCDGALSGAMSAFIQRSLASPHGPDWTGKIAAGLGDGPGMASLLAAALQAQMTWMSAGGTGAQTDLRLRHFAARLVDHVKDIGILTQEQPLAA